MMLAVVLCVAFILAIAIVIVALGRDGMGFAVGGAVGLVAFLAAFGMWHWAETASWIFAVVVGWLAGRATFIALSTKEQRARLIQKARR